MSNFHQTPEEIINHATAEQRILWNDVFLTFGEKIGIQQIQYHGVVAGSEFLIYSANKMYLLLQVNAFCGGLITGIGNIMIFNAANASIGIATNLSSYWNGTTVLANYIGNVIELKNLLISRISATLYTYINIIGYRLSV